MTIVLNKWSLASSGLVSARQVRDAAAWSRVGLVIHANLLGRLNLHDACIVDDDLDCTKPDALNRVSDLREGVL